ncbi:LysR family transcriptional regulator [Verticiella sediminum]|uniref:LysR family transcriptional regulator n=1 Tax=Verticiella sediminum TaxID=1247510 RepID=A0A556B0X8_9BURK|nr:LysR family transcriptional regulator [Verticiella sediminum]TSH98819.1 LysR family transcriptional regulator [Verticiella sediminum]
MDLEPRLLRYFVAVAEERHFSRAAQRLHISQPPLSYAIRQLEQGLGANLLERTSRSVTLTDAGRVFYREALGLLRQGEEVRTLVQRVDAGLHGRLRIGFVGSMLYRGLTEMLALLRERMPEVEHVLTELNSNEQVDAVRRGELDLGLIHQNPLPPGLFSHELVREPFVLCVPEGHPRARDATTALADFRDEEFVVFARAASPSYYETVLALCVNAGFAPHTRHEVRHWLGVIGLVARGLGVAIVPACLARCGLAGARFLAFAHDAASVSVLVAPGEQATPLQRQGVALVCEFYGVPGPQAAAHAGP